jgi:hypothetical protein
MPNLHTHLILNFVILLRDGTQYKLAYSIECVSLSSKSLIVKSFFNIKYIFWNIRNILTASVVWWSVHRILSQWNSLSQTTSPGSYILILSLGFLWNQTDYFPRNKYIKFCIYLFWPLLWSSGQSSWLQIRKPGFDSRHYQKKSSGSGKGSSQPREYNWGATW